MGVIIGFPRKPQGDPMFTFVERQLTDRIVELSNDLRAVTLQLIAVDRGRSRWPIDPVEQATLATRLLEVGRQLQDHHGEEKDHA